MSVQNWYFFSYQLQEQAAKEAAALASKKAYEASFSCPEELEAAQKLAAAAAAAVAKSKKVLLLSQLLW